MVDDDLAFLEVITRILKAKGYDVETAPSAGEAVSKARTRFHNVSIMDISLPDADGTELLSTILGMHPDTVAVMLTGHSSIQNAIQSLNRGAFAYLEKPLDPEQLLSVVARGLEKQRLVLENRRLMEELERHAHQTGVLLSVSQDVSQSLDVEHILDSALQRVTSTMHVAAGYLYLLDDGKPVLRRYRGLAPHLVTEMELSQDCGGTIDEIVRSGQPLIVEDTAACAQQELVCLAKCGYRSYAGIPLTIMGDIIGIMGVAGSAGRSFSDEDLKLLTAIGREISIAVQNAQLYEKASSNKALRELDALRTEFLANVSHELRTPLASIKGFASTLLQPDVEFDKESWLDFLQTIDKEADRLKRLIEELLVMSCLEAGALEVRRERRGIAEVIDSIKDRLTAMTPSHRLRIAVPSDLPPVAIDDGRIGEVITNLVENAVKYSEKDTQITIEACRQGSQVITTVADEGAGISPELHERVFDRFYQVEDAVTGHRMGTGLGLSICRGIVEAHGGKIWVQSQPGRGARFNFSLPASPEE